MQCPQCLGSCYEDETGRRICEECGWYEGYDIEAAIDHDIAMHQADLEGDDALRLIIKRSRIMDPQMMRIIEDWRERMRDEIKQMLLTFGQTGKITETEYKLLLAHSFEMTELKYNYLKETLTYLGEHHN